MTSIRSIPYRAWLAIAFIALLALSAIKPIDRTDFLVEHALTVIMPIAVLLLMRGGRLSNLSCTLIFVFMALHVLGAHYTYSLVPYNDWTQRLFGKSLNDMLGWQRNNFDRVVHFCWGLLLWLPMREVVGHRFGLKGFKAGIVAITILATLSACYVMIEWMASLLLSKEAADAYYGQQGDMFDAQKDAGLALIGSIIAAISLSPFARGK